MTTNAKKQNRILTAALIILIASLVGLIALTSGANRKAKPPTEDVPPVGQKLEDRSSEKTDSETSSPAPETPKDRSEKTGQEKKSAEDALSKSGSEPGDSDGKPVPEDKAAQTDEMAVPTSAGADLPPMFRAPLENAVAVKDCSLAVPVFSATMNDYRVHRGIDFACAPGTPVLAAADGTVESVAKDPMMGWTVTLSHTGGAETRYAGLSEESVNIAKAGDKVLSGQVIGASGETALIESAEENHLHFELSVGGKVVDPADYMDVVRLAEMFED